MSDYYSPVCINLFFIHYPYGNTWSTLYLFDITHKNAFNYATGGWAPVAFLPMFRMLSCVCIYICLSIWYDSRYGLFEHSKRNDRINALLLTYIYWLESQLRVFSTTYPSARRRNSLFFIVESAIFHEIMP